MSPYSVAIRANHFAFRNLISQHLLCNSISNKRRDCPFFVLRHMIEIHYVVRIFTLAI